MKKNRLIVILTVITMFCVIGGTFYHMSGFWRWWGYKDNSSGLGTSGSVDLEEFTRIEVDADIMDLTISEGENFFLDYQCTEGIEPVYKVDRGVLRITQKKQKTRFFFGIYQNNCRVHVTVPSETTLQELKLENDVGDIDIDGMISEKCNIDTDTGDCTINACSFQRSDIDTDTGNISVSDTELGTANVSSDVGDVKLENCTFRGLDAETDVGNITIDTVQDLSGYRIDLKTDVGDVYVNNQKEDHKYYSGENKEGKITVQTDVGDITLDYK